MDSIVSEPEAVQLLVNLDGIQHAREGHNQEEWKRFYSETVVTETRRAHRRALALASRVERHNAATAGTTADHVSLFWGIALLMWPKFDDRAFRSKFGTSVEVFARLWERYGHELFEKDVLPCDILMTFHYLTSNDTFDAISMDWVCARSTCHSVINKTLSYLYELLDEVSWQKRPWHQQEEIIPGPGHMLENVTFILDGTECRIAKPVDRVEDYAWFSPKHSMHAVKYEVAVSLSTGRIMWIAGGIPAAYHDSTLIRSSGLLQSIPEGERGIADAGYLGVDSRILTILRTQQEDEVVGFTADEWLYNRSVASLRIEVERVNGRLKRFQALVFSRIRNRYDHARIFHVLANFVNIWMEVEPMRVNRHPILEECPFSIPERARR